MSEQIRLRSGEQIREWSGKNTFDVVNPDDAEGPRFFQPRFTPGAGPLFLFSVEHMYLTGEGQPLVSLKRYFRAATAEEALNQYLKEPKERASGNAEQRVGFKIHSKPGATEGEAIVVTKQAGE